MKHKLLLIGAGGHCRVVLDLLLSQQKYVVVGILDMKERVGDEVFGVPVIGTDSDLPCLFKKGIVECFITVGSIGDVGLRAKLYDKAKKAGFGLPNLISSDALVSSRAVLGEGNFIAPGVIVNAGARIGNNCIVNTGVIIEHDCRIGDSAHLSPGVILSGGVDVADRVHVGTGSVVIQYLKVGENTVIGAGSVVTKNIRSNVVAYGNPCKERRNV